jgi:hypothetical protein
MPRDYWQRHFYLCKLDADCCEGLRCADGVCEKKK